MRWRPEHDVAASEASLGRSNLIVSREVVLDVARKRHRRVHRGELAEKQVGELPVKTRRGDKRQKFQERK